MYLQHGNMPLNSDAKENMMCKISENVHKKKERQEANSEVNIQCVLLEATGVDTMIKLAHKICAPSLMAGLRETGLSVTLNIYRFQICIR